MKHGKLVFTRGVNDLVAEDLRFSKFVVKCLKRHASGDWGDLCDEDKQVNNDALVNGDRLLSAYKEKPHPKIWIITEWDRSVTTVLFPDEY